MANRPAAEATLRTHEKMLALRWQKSSNLPYVPISTANADGDPYILFLDADFVDKWDVEHWGAQLAHDAIIIHEHMEKNDIEDDWPEDMLDELLPELLCKDAWEKEWPVVVGRSRPYPITPQGTVQCLFVTRP